ncbi:MAG: hypothetical protein GKR96_02030 [Gammaproteobacteria bacterium]|nr:hypothetical protein [Gammaproteobacteria bacterium]
MKQRPKIVYSAEQSALMWDRGAKGDTLHAIARLFDRGHSSIFAQSEPTGGITPAIRKCCSLSLKIAQREEISRGLVEGPVGFLVNFRLLSQQII